MDPVRIAQVGAGAVGAASGKALASHGFDVVFVDIDDAVRHRLAAQGHEVATWQELDPIGVGVFLVSVPTYTEPDPADGLRHLAAACRDIGQALARVDGYAVIVIRSTVLPGTTEGLVIPLLEESSGLRVGEDFGVCVNPEYLRERSALEDFLSPPTVVIGEYDARSGAAIARLYGWTDCPIHHVSLREAEMQKVVHNVFNAVKISFFNEARDVCESSQVDPKTVFRLVCESAEAMRNPSYGTLDLGPFSGSCLPKDTRAFLHHSEQLELPATLIRSVIEVNEERLGRKDGRGGRR